MPGAGASDSVPQQALPEIRVIRRGAVFVTLGIDGEDHGGGRGSGLLRSGLSDWHGSCGWVSPSDAATLLCGEGKGAS